MVPLAVFATLTAFSLFSLELAAGQSSEAFIPIDRYSSAAVFNLEACVRPCLTDQVNGVEPKIGCTNANCLCTHADEGWAFVSRCVDNACSGNAEDLSGAYQLLSGFCSSVGVEYGFTVPPLAPASAPGELGQMKASKGVTLTDAIASTTSSTTSTPSSSPSPATSPQPTTTPSSTMPSQSSSSSSSEPRHGIDPVALGVPLGMGIPVILFSAFGCWYQIHYRPRKRKKRARVQARVQAQSFSGAGVKLDDLPGSGAASGATSGTSSSPSAADQDRVVRSRPSSSGAAGPSRVVPT